MQSKVFLILITLPFVSFYQRELLSPAQKYQLLVYHADSIFHDKEYRNAACKYSMALQQKKVISKTSKVRTSTGGAASNLQAQVCRIALFNVLNEAITSFNVVLTRIPTHQLHVYSYHSMFCTLKDKYPYHRLVQFA